MSVLVSTEDVLEEHAAIGSSLRTWTHVAVVEAVGREKAATKV